MKPKIILFTFCSDYKHILDVISDLNFQVEISENSESLNKLRSSNIVCLIVYMQDLPLSFLYKLKENFPNVPCLMIVTDDLQVDTIRYCGELGIESGLHINDLHRVNDTLDKLINIYVKPQISDFNIDFDNASPLLKKALRIIEKDFIDLFTSNEIAQRLEVTDGTLSREFNRYNICGPKKLLMYFKLKYAVILLQTNYGYSVADAARLAGFTSSKRMIECFRRVYDQTPGALKESPDELSHYNATQIKD